GPGHRRHGDRRVPGRLRHPVPRCGLAPQTLPNREVSMDDDRRPNFLILCMDQWDTHMRVPEAVRFPTMTRLEAEGVSFDRQYCTVPICTPSRATMWTGVHARHTGLWDNTNFAWTDELSADIPTI